MVDLGDWAGGALVVRYLRNPYLKAGDGPIVLVLAPTRELAVQIKEECDKFGSSSDIKNTVVYGGVKKQTQIASLQQGVEVLIATPGRLIDHLDSKNTNLKRVTYLVLDEADRFALIVKFSCGARHGPRRSNHLPTTT